MARTKTTPTKIVLLPHCARCENDRHWYLYTTGPRGAAARSYVESTAGTWLPLEETHCPVCFKQRRPCTKCEQSLAANNWRGSPSWYHRTKDYWSNCPVCKLRRAYSPDDRIRHEFSRHALVRFPTVLQEPVLFDWRLPCSKCAIDEFWYTRMKRYSFKSCCPTPSCGLRRRVLHTHAGRSRGELYDLHVLWDEAVTPESEVHASQHAAPIVPVQVWHGDVAVQCALCDQNSMRGVRCSSCGCFVCMLDVGLWRRMTDKKLPRCPICWAFPFI